MNAAELKKAKKEVRRRVRSLRDAIPAIERDRSTRAIHARVLREIEARPGVRTVLCYWSFGSEVEMSGLIDALVERGFVVALPRIAGGELEARTFRPGDPVSETSFGAMEPAGGELVPPEAIDVVLTPGLAFDRAGNRTGYGGGFYDRLLPRTKPNTPRIAVAFGIQVVEEVPSGGFDVPVDVIVTENEIVRTR